MKKAILFVAILVLSMAGLVQAQEGELGATLDVTYRSSYIWRGFDYYAEDDPSLEASIDLDLYGSGFGVIVLNRQPLSGGHENAKNLNATLYYSNKLYETEAYATNYTLAWTYYGFPDEPKAGSKTHSSAQAADMQDIVLALSWPSICPAGFVPSYTVLTMWPSEGDSAASGNSGWAHILGLGYDLAVQGILPDTPEQILNLSAALVYNDGTAPGVVINAASGSVDHDWSHAVFGVSTDFNIADNLSVTPGGYYQLSMEDTVNDEDEIWLTVSMKYKF
jgi:hypothetical protein